MALQLLEHQKRVGEKVYRYYSLAEPYREDGKNKKKVLSHLGPLNPDQVIRIRQTLRLSSDPNCQVMSPSAIEIVSSRRYVELALFHELWKRLDVDSVIGKGDGDIELSKLFEILVLNRITDPTSRLGITRWYPSTALPELLGVPTSAINESRFYRALDSIEKHHNALEGHLLKKISKFFSPSSIYFYDLSSSYFEGDGVTISAFNEHSKDHRPDRPQVVLGLLINEKGIPFSWEVLRGNQGDAPMLIEQIKKFKKRFNIPEALLVFDRGFLSHDNLAAVEKAGYQYLTGLRGSQIETILLKYPQEWIAKINTDTVEDIVSHEKQWHRFDETGFYCPIGEFNGKQTILLFDTARFKRTVIRRQIRIDEFKKWVIKHNEWLASFKKDAVREAIANDLDTEIKRRELAPFVSYELHQYITKNETFQRRKNNPYPSQGYMRKIKSFQVIVKENNRSPLDGLFALVTSPKSKLSPEDMMILYRQKYLVENAFREMKSILKLRPWFVYTESHVRAHYTVCVVAFILERMLDLLLEENHVKEEGYTLGRLKEELSRFHLVEMKIGSSKHKTLQKIPAELAAILKKIGLQKALTLPN